LLPRQKEEEQEERTEKNGKEHGRRRSAPPLEIIACSRGISECGRKAVSGERQGPEPGYIDREGERERNGRRRLYEEEGGDVVSNPRTQSFVSIHRPVHRCVGR
jgi:hypothetical protein